MDKKFVENTDKRIGLALGGGGARGLAHIGVLKVFEREKIPIHLMTGTSMGGVIGALLAAGIPVKDMEAEACNLGGRRKQLKLVDIELSKSGLLKGERIYQLLASYLGEELTFADLRIPLAVIAVDYHTGGEVVLKEGRIVDAIRATISVPGAFVPVKRGDLLLVDGGVLNNVPVDVAYDLGARAVIGVDVLPNFPQDKSSEPLEALPVKIPAISQSITEIMHIQMIMISEMTELRLKCRPPNVLIRPDLPPKIGLFVGFSYAKEAIALGEAAAEQALPQILELVRNPS
jgi:NTE family protein